MSDPVVSRVLAETLRLQRWAGGDSVDAARVFGLTHGVESVIRQERESPGISEETQEKVEDILEDIEAGQQSVVGRELKHRLLRDKLDEPTVATVVHLCQLQSRFLDAAKRLAERGSHLFGVIGQQQLPEREWLGAQYYVELVDCSEGDETPMHAVMVPALPRVGERVVPQAGTVMEVVGVEHRAASQEHLTPRLVPHVLLVPAEGLADD